MALTTTDRAAAATLTELDAFGPLASRRDTDPLALALLSQLFPSSAEDRMLIWRALGGRVDGGLSERGRQALDAATVCFDDVCAEAPDRRSSKALSEREYTAWYEGELAAGRRWPSVSSVRKWLGGNWVRVQEALGQTPAAAATARRLAAIGGEFTPDGLATQLRRCREALGVEAGGRAAAPLDYVSIAAHRRWALSEMAKPPEERVLPRLCLQPHPFRAQHGSWPEAVIASGGGREKEAQLAMARVRRGRKDYDIPACADALVRVAPGCGWGKMTWNSYEARAGVLREEAAGAGLVLSLPSAQVIVARLGSWPAALLRAGLISEAECELRLARVAPTLDDNELLAILAEALVVLGPGATVTDYVDEREDRRVSRGGRPDWPSCSTIYQRIGHWEESVAAVVEAYTDVLDAWDLQVAASLEREAG